MKMNKNDRVKVSDMEHTDTGIKISSISRMIRIDFTLDRNTHFHFELVELVPVVTRKRDFDSIFLVLCCPLLAGDESTAPGTCQHPAACTDT